MKKPKSKSHVKWRPLLWLAVFAAVLFFITTLNNDEPPSTQTVSTPITVTTPEPAEPELARVETVSTPITVTTPEPAEPELARVETVSTPITVATPEPAEPELQAIQTSDSSSRSVVVTAEEYGDRWPLTVPEARVVLLNSYVAIAVTTEGTYALNGTAQSRGYAPINPIWRDNPAIPGTKISISLLIQLALSLAEPAAATPSNTSTPEPAEPEPLLAVPESTDEQDTLGGSTGETVEAWVVAKQFVEKQLKSPSTAKFRGYASSPYVVYLGDRRYRVTASVDSQNSFGAMIRTEFVAIVRAERDDHQTWILESLEF